MLLYAFNGPFYRNFFVFINPDTKAAWLIMFKSRFLFLLLCKSHSYMTTVIFFRQEIFLIKAQPISPLTLNDKTIIQTTELLCTKIPQSQVRGRVIEQWKKKLQEL